MDDNVETQPDFFKGEVSTTAAKTNKGKFVLSPFVRLSRVHALSAAGDAMITVALAGSLFFSIDPSAARWRVGLYLALTIAPFAVVSPLIGPVIDRYAGGRRLMILAINILRVITAAAASRTSCWRRRYFVFFSFFRSGRWPPSGICLDLQ